MIYKLIPESDLVQGSSAWLDARLRGLGASEIATVMNENPYETAYNLWQIKTGLKQAPDLSDNFAIKRGHALEPKARELANDRLNRNFIPCNFQSTITSYMRYSSDGFDQAANELIEIKCPGAKNHEIIVRENAPLPYYIAQLQWALLITGARSIHFVSYNQEFADPLHIVEVFPDRDYQEEMITKAAHFWQLVETKTPPELTDRDFEDVSSEAFKELVFRYKAAKDLEKMAKESVEKAENDLKAAANGRSIVGNGLKISQVFRKGNIDYSAIEALKDIDLEQFRKAPSQYQKISFLKDNQAT